MKSRHFSITGKCICIEVKNQEAPRRKEPLMEHKIDIDRLREDILDYYGTAMFNDFAMAAMNVQFIEMASDQDLIAIAQKEGVDLTKYIR